MAKKKNEETIVDVQEVYTKTEMFVDKNRKLLTGVLLGIAVIVAVYFAYTRLYLLPQEKNASEEMWKAEQYFAIDSLDLAMYGDEFYPGFEQISEDYSGTKTALRAHYYMGIIEREKGEHEVALEHFKKASKLDDSSIGPIATGNVGDAYVELGNYPEAIKYFEKAAQKGNNSFTTPFYLYKAGLAHMEEGQNDRAIKAFKTIAEDYPDSGEFRSAKKYLASLGGS